MDTNTKLLLVDDHALFRSGLRSILQGYADIDVAGEAETGEAAIEYVRKDPPDIVMMDVNMPGIGGIEATRKILRVNETVGVIAVTVLSEAPFPSQLLDAGARGFISKGCTADELVASIHAVRRGEHYLSADVARKISLASLVNRGGPALATLTARELQILMMITQGIANHDIADALYLSPKTVSTYRSRLYDKLGICNEIELTQFAIRHGLIDHVT